MKWNAMYCITVVSLAAVCMALDEAEKTALIQDSLMFKLVI